MTPLLVSRLSHLRNRSRVKRTLGLRSGSGGRTPCHQLVSGKAICRACLGLGGNPSFTSTPHPHSLVHLSLHPPPPPTLMRSATLPQLLGHTICLCSPFPRGLAPFIETFK